MEVDYPLVSKFIPEKEPEFKEFYSKVLEMIQLRKAPSSTPDMIKYFIKDFEIQRSILLSIPSVTMIKELIK